MANHTPEPWAVWEETAYDNDGFPETVIKALNGRAGIAVTIDFGPNNPGMREANARRIVACVNACKGLSNEDLENGALFSAAGIELFGENNEIKILSKQLAAVTAQRDELLAALKQTRKELNSCRSVIHYHGGFDPAYVQDALKAIKLSDSAIAKCEVKNER